MQRKAWVSNVIIGVMLMGILCLALPFDSIVASAKTEGVYYKGDTNKPNASLMINVYQGSEFIEPIMHALTEGGAKATFFVGGSWASRNPEIVKKIVDNGFEIGNHGYLHKDHDKISAERQSQEITTCHDLIKQLTGVEMTLFAPPSGAYNRTTVEICNTLNYKTIMWTLDTIDWRDKSSDLVFKRATKKIQNGNLILMHPTAHTLEALPSVINAYTRAGIQLVSVSDNIMSTI